MPQDHKRRAEDEAENKNKIVKLNNNNEDQKLLAVPYDISISTCHTLKERSIFLVKSQEGSVGKVNHVPYNSRCGQAVKKEPTTAGYSQKKIVQSAATSYSETKHILKLNIC